MTEGFICLITCTDNTEANVIKAFVRSNYKSNTGEKRKNMPL